jgi:hypothetical protein
VFTFFLRSVRLAPTSALQALVSSLVGAGLQAAAIVAFAQAASMALDTAPATGIPTAGFVTSPGQAIVIATLLLVLGGVAQYFGTAGIYDAWRISQAIRLSTIHSLLVRRSTDDSVSGGDRAHLKSVARDARTALVQSGQAIRIGLSSVNALARAAFFAALALLQLPGLTLLVLIPASTAGAILAVTAASGNARRTRRIDALRSSTSVRTEAYLDSAFGVGPSDEVGELADSLETTWGLLFESLKKAARARALMASVVLPALVGIVALFALEFAAEDQTGAILTTGILLLLTILQISAATSNTVLVGRFSPAIARFDQAMQELAGSRV